MASLSSLKKKLKDLFDNSSTPNFNKRDPLAYTLTNNPIGRKMESAQKWLESPTSRVNVPIPKMSNTNPLSVPLRLSKGVIEGITTEPLKIGGDLGQILSKGRNAVPASYSVRLGQNLADYKGGASPLSTVGNYGDGKWNVPWTKIKLPEFGLSESPLAKTVGLGIGATEPIMTAVGAKNLKGLATYLGLAGGINTGAAILSGDKSMPLEKRFIQGASEAAPRAAQTVGFVGATNKLMTLPKGVKVPNKLKLLKYPTQSGANVAQGLAQDKVMGQESSGTSVLIDALFPAASELTSKSFKTIGEATKAVDIKVKQLRNIPLKNNKGWNTTPEKYAKGTRAKRKNIQQLNGAMLGLEPYQDEDGSWKIRFNRDRALIGLGLTAGISKVGGIKNADSALKGMDSKQADPLITEARKYKSAEEFVRAKTYTSNKADIEEFFKRDGDGRLFNSATVKANKKINKDGTIELVHLTTPEGKLGIEKGGFKEGTWFGLHNNRAISRPGSAPTVTMKIKVDPSDMAFGRYALNRSKLVKGADGVYRPEKVSQLTDIWNQATKSTEGLGDNSRLDTQGKYQAELDSSPVSPQIQPAKMPISKQSSTQSFDKSLAEIEKTVYGSATPSQAELGGTKDSAGFLTDILRRGQAGVSSKVGSLTESPKSAVRNIGRLLEGFGGGLGKTQTQVEAKGVFGGGKDYAAKIGGDVQKYVNNVLGNSKESAARVWEILDPELSKTKLTYEDLTPQEKEATDFLRQVSDFINDTNHKNGFISDELWKKNKGGKYIARAYEAFDLPPEVADFVKQSQAKFDLNPFKQRTEVNDWKEANAMRDPAYLMGKRLQQTLFNDSVHKMSASMMKTGLVSDVAKPGYVQVSDHKAYGDMSGKWVRKDALEDIKGFFYESDVAQKAYDLISWYDRNPVRKTYKKLFTVFNPAVRLGNKTGNYVFAWLSGINPATFAKNQVYAKGEVRGSGPLYRRALKDGLVGTDITKADITKMAVELKSGVQDKNILRRIDETLQNRYGETDDIAKVAALKTFLDRGYTYEEAARRVYNGFQNYRTVGWLYDVGSKIPVLGNPFVRFKADFGRILKNAVIEHPFRLASTIIAYQLFTDAMSRMSGETTVDKDTRENRFGSPRIPFTQTSLAVQTPFGEINAARLLGAYGTNLGENDMAGDISDYSPIKNPLNARNYGTDPVVGPVISTAMDKDFRGKSIKDPNQSKYTGSLLTPNEQRANQGKFLLRSYTPTVLNSGADLVSAVRGDTDFYGRTKTPTQAALRVYPGVKFEQFGAKEAEAQRTKDKQFEEYKREDIKSKTKTINKQLSEGKITYKQAEARKQALKDGVKAKVSFEKSEDSPRNIAEKTALYGKALQTDPSGAIKGMFTEERARKMRGDALIFERKNNLNTGGTDMELDHTASLGLGGDNSADNLVYYPHDVKVKKDALEKKLIKQLEDGEITEKEAQDTIKAWTADNPTTAKEPTNTGKDKEYKIKTKTGKTVKVDIDSPIVKPKLSGLKELDKGLVSKYNSSITTRINNIQKVYADGQIQADKANADIKKLLESKIDTSKPKKAKKRSGVRISLPKSKTYKIKGLSKLSSRINSKPVKFKKLKLAKLKFAKAKPIKFNRKVAVKKKPIKFKNTLSGNLTRLT